MKKNTQQKNRRNLFQHFGARKPEALWSEMNERALGVSRPALHKTYNQANIGGSSSIDSLVTSAGFWFQAARQQQPSDVC